MTRPLLPTHLLPGRARRMLVRRPRGRRGMVLLFVVVLLTLLAVLGSAYLVSSRIDAGQISPESRGGEANIFGISAAERVEQVMDETQLAVQKKLFLDLFAYNGILPATAGAVPSAARELGDVSMLGVPTQGAGDGTPDLLWRAFEVNRQGFMPVPAGIPGTPPAAQEIGIFRPMAPFMTTPAAGPAMRGIHEGTAGSPESFTVQFPYFHVDAVGGTDPFLASRLPVFDNFRTGATNEFIWPWVSGAIVGVPNFTVDNIAVDPFGTFADPVNNSPWLNLDYDDLNTPEVEGERYRSNLIPTTIGPVAYPPPLEEYNLTGGDAQYYNDRLRVWPALAGDFNGDGTVDPVDEVIVAADADGDGVADSLLVPIVFNESAPIGTLDRYIDPQTGHAYLVTIRIVDNNAAININTALTSHSDLLLPAAPPNLPINLSALDYEATFGAGVLNQTVAGPNRGIYPSNIGLYELFNIGGGGSGMLRSDQFRSLLPLALGQPGVAAATMDVSSTSGLTLNSVPIRNDMQYATLGELLSMNRDRMLDFPQLTANGVDLLRPYRSVQEERALLAKGGGWLLKDEAPTRVENAAFDALRIAAGNFVPNPELVFEFFPLGPDIGVGSEATGFRGNSIFRALWAAHFKHADPDMTTLADFEAAYAGVGALGTRFGGGPWPLSPRAALVTRNGVSQAFRPHWQNITGTDLSTATLPKGMPPYAPSALSLVPHKPPVRASVNTAGFSELWRAFWNIMVVADEFNATGPTTLVPAYTAVDPNTGATTAVNTSDRMFRNDLFESFGVGPGSAVPTEYQVLTLRAALAAINTLDIRDVDDATNLAITRLTAADVELEPDPASPLPSTYFARVYGGEAQPFITEMIVVWDPALTGVMYVAIELYNPYPFDIDLSDWYLVGVGQRTGTGALPYDMINLTGTAPTDWTQSLGDAFPAGIPANSHIVVHTLAAPPAPLAAPPGGTQTFVTTIQPSMLMTGDEISREIYLARPLNPATAALNPPTGGHALLQDWVAVDIVSPMGMRPNVATADADETLVRWRYYRVSGVEDAAAPGTIVADPRGWKFVSHGRYTGTPIEAGYPWSGGMVPMLNAGLAGDANFEGGLGEPDAVAPADLADYEIDFGPVRSIPWGPVAAGPAQVDLGGGTAQPIYPYGGFARDGDALGIPFFGAYRIHRDTNNDGVLQVPDPLVAAPPPGPPYDEPIAWVPPTLDAFFADSEDIAVAPATTHVGRFIPQGAGYKPNPLAAGEVVDEGYNWAADFFEYITTLHAPNDDWLPHADNRYVNNTTTDPENNLLVNPDSVPLPGTAGSLFTQGLVPNLIDNDLDGFSNGLMFDITSGTWQVPTTPAEVARAYEEAFLPVEGLVNINTAGFGILKLLPLAIDATGAVDYDRIRDATNPGSPLTGLAGSLYLGRWDTTFTAGAYASLFEVNRLPQDMGAPAGEFRDFGSAAGVTRRMAGDITGMNWQANPTYQDIASDATDSWYFDHQSTVGVAITERNYEDDTVQLTRLSNLTTTRSDSYTVYIVVQAWENFGNPPGAPYPGPARMIRQERAAFTVDRSGVTPFNPAATTPFTPWLPADINTGDAWRDALKITPIPVK